MDEQLQAQFKAALEALLNSDDPSIRAAAEAYGDFGDDAVLVSFNAANLRENDDAGQRGGDFDSEFDDDGNVIVSPKQFTITFRPEKVLDGGGYLQSIVGHEGSHQADDNALFASYDKETTRFDSELFLTHRETEDKAYFIEHKIAKRNGIRSKKGDRNGHVVGTIGKGISDNRARNEIKKIIDSDLYPKRDERKYNDLFKRFNEDN